jgi:serine/threonine protein kinase
MIMDNLIGKVIGGCRIESKIGQGGMGAVFHAHHEGLDIPVAVKILSSTTAMDNARERFLREARIAARLRHPNIVAVHNVGREQDIDFIVMEYVEGKNLKQIIKQQDTLPLGGAIRIALQVLYARDVALKNGIVHRDIKPENILIDASGNAKLADLGLARSSADVTLTQGSVVLGSPQYVAPEQADNPLAADIRADIYSLGCTLFHMLTGTPPFPGSSPIEIILNHTRQPVPRLREKNPAFPEALDQALFIMMQKSPQERYQNPSEAIAALSAVVPGMEYSATQPAAPLRHKKSQGKPVLAWAALFVVVVLAAGAAVMLLQQKKAPTPVAPAPLVAQPDTLVSDSVARDTTPPAKKEPEKTAPKKPKQPVKKTVQTKKPQTEQKTSGKKQSGRDPVLSAVKIGDTEALLRLLNEGMSPNGLPGTGTTPLHEAVRRGSADQVRLLTEHGANTNVRDNRGDAPLHYALRADERLMVRELLQHGADPNIKDRRGKTPLTIAGSVNSELESMIKEFGGR